MVESIISRNTMPEDRASVKASTMEEGRKGCCSRFTLLWSSSKAIIDKTFWMLFHIGFSLFVTFITFPGVTGTTSLSFIDSRAWFDLFMVTTFNVFDTIGRYLGGTHDFSGDPHTKYPFIHAVGFGRMIFVVFGILIMVQVSIFPEDWIIITNQALFALTNGYMQTVCFIIAPMLVEAGAD